MSFSFLKTGWICPVQNGIIWKTEATFDAREKKVQCTYTWSVFIICITWQPGLSLTLSAGGEATSFHSCAKLFELELLTKKNFLLDDQTRQAKSLSQLVNFPSAWPWNEPLDGYIMYYCLTVTTKDSKHLTLLDFSLCQTQRGVLIYLQYMYILKTNFLNEIVWITFLKKKKAFTKKQDL